MLLIPHCSFDAIEMQRAHTKRGRFKFLRQLLLTGHDCGRLVVDAALESSGAPVYKLDGALGLDGGHGGVDILGHHVAAVHEAARHVLAVARVTSGMTSNEGPQPWSHGTC